MIKLKEIESMVQNVEGIMKQPLKTEQEYQELIDTIVLLEKEAYACKETNNESPRIITLCNLMIFKLMLKITHVLEFEAYSRRKIQ